MMREDAAEIKGVLEVEIVAVPAAAAPAAKDYSLTLFMGDDMVGHVAVSPSDSWAQFLDKVNSAHLSHGSKVEWIKYDDTYGPDQETDIQCRDQTDWEVPPKPLECRTLKPKRPKLPEPYLPYPIPHPSTPSFSPYLRSSRCMM